MGVGDFKTEQGGAEHRLFEVYTLDNMHACTELLNNLITPGKHCQYQVHRFSRYSSLSLPDCLPWNAQLVFFCHFRNTLSPHSRLWREKVSDSLCYATAIHLH